MSNLKNTALIYCFFSTIIVCILLKRHLCTSKEFLLVFLTGRVDPHRIWIHRCLRPLFLGGWLSYVWKATPKKNQAKKTWMKWQQSRWWGYSHPNGLSSLLKLGKDCIVTVLDFKFQSGFFSQIPPNAPFFFPWFLQLLSREMFRSGNIRRSCVEKLDKLWCWCLAKQTWYATN